MPTGRDGVVGGGDSVDMGGVLLPIGSRQALAEAIPMDRSRSMGLTTPREQMRAEETCFEIFDWKRNQAGQGHGRSP